MLGISSTTPVKVPLKGLKFFSGILLEWNGFPPSGLVATVTWGNPLLSSLLASTLTAIALSSIPTAAGGQDYHFGECQLIVPIGAPVTGNLFNKYWLPYYSQLYNPDTRVMTLKVDLRASDVNEFNFQDTVFIKNREFRVNKIDYKPNDLSTVEFILLT